MSDLIKQQNYARPPSQNQQRNPLLRQTTKHAASEPSERRGMAFFPLLSHSIIPIVQPENISSWFDILSVATLLSGISVCVVRGYVVLSTRLAEYRKRMRRGKWKLITAVNVVLHGILQRSLHLLVIFKK